MNLSFLSKTLSTFGLMALIATIVGSGISKTAQAQNLPQPLNFTEEEMAELAAACDRTTQENSEPSPDGNGLFFDTLRAMNVTDQQRSAYSTLLDQADEKRAEIYENSVSVPNPANIMFMWSGPIDPTVESAITAVLNQNPKIDELAALNQQFGQYGVFTTSYFHYYTPEQDAQLGQITDDFNAQFEALLTPEQQLQYRENLAAGERIRSACEWDGPIFSYPAMGRISNTIPEGMITETRSSSIL
jgi:hypothetical protein